MGLFDKKDCALCGGKAGLLFPTKIQNGYLCGDCRKRFSEYTENVGSMTLEDVEEQIRIKEENDARFADEFETTRCFDFDSRHTIMQVDDHHGWFIFPKDNNTDIFTFDQIESFNVDLSTTRLTDEEREQMRRQNGTGIWGVLNFLLSDDFVSRYPDLPHCPRDRKIIGMYFDIRFGSNPFRAEKVHLDMMPGWNNNQQAVEKAYQCANDMYQCIKEYKSGMRSVSGYADQREIVPEVSAAQQIKEYKELLDIGALTQEEFDAKKKQLLGL